MLLSICIPTFNRANNLANCLNSIVISNNFTNLDEIEVCVSDNCSSDNTRAIVESFKDKINIHYSRNEKNLGFAINSIKVISMASGKYSWLIGDDDLIIPASITKLIDIFKKNTSVDYFFINSYYLNSNYLKKFKSPFNTKNLELKTLKKLSDINENKVVNFWQIIDPKVSWEFLIGIYLSIFNTKKWIKASAKVDTEKLKDVGVWSNFENTCLHPIVIAEAFKDSQCYICSDALSVNLSGEREWGDLYEFVEIVRIPELLDYYRKQGLSYINFFKCKNFSLRNYTNYFFKILFGGRKKGRIYINYRKHFINNLIYPNFYFSFLFFLLRKIKYIVKKLFKFSGKI